MANTVTAVVHTDVASATVTVTMDAPVTSIRLERADENGDRTIVRSCNSVLLTAGAFSIDDFEVPLDQDFVYVATQTVPTSGTPATVTSATYVVASNGATWLKDPAMASASRNLRIDEVESLASVSREAAAGVFSIIDRRYPIVVASARHGWAGDFTFHTASLSQRGTLVELLTRGQVLLLSTPDGYGIGNVYVHVGDVTEDRVTGVGKEQSRKWTLPMTMVERPPILSTEPLPMRWVDVIYNWATWGDLKNDPAVATWGDLLKMPRP